MSLKRNFASLIHIFVDDPKNKFWAWSAEQRLKIPVITGRAHMNRVDNTWLDASDIRVGDNVPHSYIHYKEADGT